MPNLTFTEEELEALAEKIAHRLFVKLNTLLNNKEDEILSFDEACRFLKCNKGWLYEKVRFNKIPYVKTGRYLKFKKSELLKWIERNSTKTK